MPPEEFLPAAFSSADSSLIGEEHCARQDPENRVLSLENPRAGGFHMIAYDAPVTDFPAWPIPRVEKARWEREPKMIV